MHVFFATDGSQYSQTAEQILAEFPFKERPRLTLAHVCAAADLHSIASDVTSPITAMLDRCRDEATKLLQSISQRCGSWAGETSFELLDGHHADSLLSAVERLRPDVVVCGARGLGAVRRMLLGSVSERLAKHAPCSVLVVHHSPHRTATRTIVMAHDGSPTADSALRCLTQWKSAPDLTVHLVAVVETVRLYGTEMILDGTGGIEHERRQAQLRLEEATRKLAPLGAKVTCEVHTSQDVAGCILDVAEARQADLIVIGSRGKSAWERFLLGSTSLRVLHHAPCSVWIERVQQPEDE